MANAHIRNSRQRRIFHKYMARFAIQSRAFTAGAGAITDELRQLFAHRAGFRLFITALHIMQHAFERMAAHGGIAAIVHIFKFNVLFAGTVQHDFMYVGAEACPRRIYVELIVFRQRLEHLKVVKLRRSQPRIAPPASDRSGFWITRSGSKYC